MKNVFKDAVHFHNYFTQDWLPIAKQQLSSNVTIKVLSVVSNQLHNDQVKVRLFLINEYEDEVELYLVGTKNFTKYDDVRIYLYLTNMEPLELPKRNIMQTEKIITQKVFDPTTIISDLAKECFSKTKMERLLTSMRYDNVIKDPTTLPHQVHYQIERRHKLIQTFRRCKAMFT